MRPRHALLFMYMTAEQQVVYILLRKNQPVLI